MATVWDGEIAGVRGALEAARKEEKVLIITDSEAASFAIGDEAVRFSWVKAHVGVFGNEQADRLAKQGAGEQDWERETANVEECPGSYSGPRVSGEWIGRRWSSWEQADDRERWLRKRKDRDKEVFEDLLETFFQPELQIRGWFRSLAEAELMAPTSLIFFDLHWHLVIIILQIFCIGSFIGSEVV
ncbi:hypothetical protein BGX38DRAFT_1268492 [Terfezia claveryi]|nr:hypothetical protein BGX38DRAFT_1268492 [Terfezia claveryi]